MNSTTCNANNFCWLFKCFSISVSTHCWTINVLVVKVLFWTYKSTYKLESVSGCCLGNHSCMVHNSVQIVFRRCISLHLSSVFSRSPLYKRRVDSNSRQLGYMPSLVHLTTLLAWNSYHYGYFDTINQQHEKVFFFHFSTILSIKLCKFPCSVSIN